MTQNFDFDMRAAWLRRFNADAQSNLKAFALRLKEAMPELVTIHQTRGFFQVSRKPPVSRSTSVRADIALRSMAAG
jgi:hypothetical protein